MTFVLAVVVLVGVQLFLTRTQLGRMMRASSDDPVAARVVGGDVKHVYATAMAIAFGTIALAGLLFGMRSSFDPSIGPARLIFAFEAVVIGGLGSLWGTLVGGVVLGLAQTIFAQIDPAWTLLGGHLIFLAVLAFRPQGLIPARSAGMTAPTRGLSESLVARAATASAPVLRARRYTRWTTLGLIAAVAVLAYLPYLVFATVTDAMVTFFLLLTMATMWNLLAGYAGLVSIGQQAYIGLGAYAVLQLSDWGVQPYLGVVLAAGIAALFALPTSWLAFRLRGDYFAVGTWVIAEVYRLVTVRDSSFGGGSGRSLTALSGMDQAVREALTYWVALAVAVVAVAASYLLLRSRLGLALTAIRDDERAAASAGVAVSRAKRIVYLVAAAGCGAAGGVLLISTLDVHPDSAYSVQWSAYMIFIVVLGGIGSLEGPIIGTIVFFAAQRLFSDYGSWYLVGLGVLAIAAAVWLPGGVWGEIRKRTGLELFGLGHRVGR